MNHPSSLKFFHKHLLPRSRFPSGMWVQVSKKYGYLHTHTPEGVDVLYSIRESTPLSIYQILKYPLGATRESVIENEELTHLTDGRSMLHSCGARWLATKLSATARDELIEQGHVMCVPDKVYESVTHRSIQVIYGIHRFVFFRGDRKDTLSDKDPRYDVLSKELVPPRILHRKILTHEATLELSDKARIWAKRMAQIIPRVADKDHTARRKIERQQSMNF